MKRRKWLLILLILFILVAFAFIGVGLYFNRLSKPSAIFGKVVDEVSSNVLKYTKVDNALVVGDKFTIGGDLKFEVDSEYHWNRYYTDLDSAKTYNTLVNLNQMNTSFLIKQDKSKKTSYLDIHSLLGEQDFFFYKLFVTNSTQYFYLDGVADTYVNDGTCNYFETLGEEITTKDNIDYLNQFLVDSIKRQMKDEYFQNYVVNQMIDDKEKNVNQISIRFTDSMIHTLLKGILKDLKEDPGAFKILSNIDSNFSRYKVKDEQTFLAKEESYTLNIYTTKILYTPLKFELLHLNGDSKSLVVYEGNYSSGTIYYSEDDKVLYQMPVKNSSHQFLVDIQDTRGNHLGEVRLEKNQHNVNFNYSLDVDDVKYDIVYSSKFDSITKKKSYQNEKKLSFKIIDHKESRLNGTVLLNYKVENVAKIEEDISDAILKSSLTEEQMNLYDTKIETIKTRLEQ